MTSSGGDSAVTEGARTEATTIVAKCRPLITPEQFTGIGSFQDWVDHFEGVAANDWNEDAKLLWMRVRLVGRAQTAYGRLPDTAKASYTALKKALKERFEPDSRRELYLSEFSARKRRPGEGWAEYADELRVLADKAFPELEERARERLALNQYLGQLDNPQVAFNVKQKRPASLVDAVGSTLEMESYLLPRTGQVAQVGVEPEPIIAAVQSKQDSIMGMLQNVMERLDKLEKQAFPKAGYPEMLSRSNPVVCHKCGQEGHFARGCASRPKRKSGPISNPSRDAIAVVPVSRSYTVSGHTNGIPTTFILDTGAAITLLRKDLWDKLPPSKKQLEPWEGRPLVGVAGTSLDVCGSAVVEIIIAGESFRNTVVVASALTAEAILGLDFLESNNCTLETGSRIL